MTFNVLWEERVILKLYLLAIRRIFPERHSLMRNHSHFIPAIKSTFHVRIQHKNMNVYDSQYSTKGKVSHSACV